MAALDVSGFRAIAVERHAESRRGGAGNRSWSRHRGCRDADAPPEALRAKARRAGVLPRSPNNAPLVTCPRLGPPQGPSLALLSPSVSPKSAVEVGSEARASKCFGSGPHHGAGDEVAPAVDSSGSKAPQAQTKCVITVPILVCAVLDAAPYILPFLIFSVYTSVCRAAFVEVQGRSVSDKHGVQSSWPKHHREASTLRRLSCCTTDVPWHSQGAVVLERARSYSGMASGPGLEDSGHQPPHSWPTTAVSSPPMQDLARKTHRSPNCETVLGE